MNAPVAVAGVRPTVFIRRGRRGLEQRLVVTFSARKAGRAALRVERGRVRTILPPVDIPPGESAHDVFVPVADRTAAAAVRIEGSPAGALAFTLRPPRRWTVHVVHTSHHDAGYTDLPSRVRAEHVRLLDRAVEIADAEKDLPPDGRFRAVVEQAWSLADFLRDASPGRRRRMLELLRSGEIEAAALFGNMTGELCGHETLVRSLYHTARLKREHGIRIVSAEHNDVPGFPWGLCRALRGAGIELFCPTIPHYHRWGNAVFPSFWDERAIFGTEGVPGAFWWAAPGGGRVLFWSGNQGGAACDPALAALAGRLAFFEESGCPWDVVRWPVLGAARDNAPYIPDYAAAIRRWNDAWAFPRLVSSTNAIFYDDLAGGAPLRLRTFAGGVPGQDYPPGSTSTAEATAANRGNHADLPTAEKLSTAASIHACLRPPAAVLDAAADDVLRHDEHTWGFHFPCGPAARASAHEKACHAFRAAALLQDVRDKAAARIADRIVLSRDGLHLAVFNPSSFERTDFVDAPLREFDNCGSELVLRKAGEEADGPCLRPAILTDRWRVHPPAGVVAGRFRLFDAATGEEVPYGIAEIGSPLGGVPFAAERLGLAAGGKRYGIFEDPSGLRRSLRFTARGVPPLGYRLYRIEPGGPPSCPSLRAAASFIENEFHRVERNPRTGRVVAITDKATGRALLVPAAEPSFGELIAAPPGGPPERGRTIAVLPPRADGASVSFAARFTVRGHPVVEQTTTLRAGLPRIETAVHVVKDPEPLLSAFVVFPFAVRDGRFLCDTPLAAGDPEADRLPGAFLDRVTVGDWVSVSDGRMTVLWSSLDAPVASFGGLRPDRVSPAHACRHAGTAAPPPVLRGGTIVSCVAANNFGTNFAVSQSGTLLFRYAAAFHAGPASPAAASVFGEAARSPLVPVFTRHPGPRTLPPAAAFLRVSDPGVRVLTLKTADDGDGCVVRLWNPEGRPVRVSVSLPRTRIARAVPCSMTEEAAGPGLPVRGDSFAVRVAGRDLATVRLTLAPERNTP